jgi:hypothetical protein
VVEKLSDFLVGHFEKKLQNFFILLHSHDN